MVCMKHSTESIAKDHGTVQCKTCREERHRPEYDTATLQRLQDLGALADAVCLRCDASVLKGTRQEKGTSQTYQCNHCRKPKSLTEYSGVMLKVNDLKRMRCLDCQSPACMHCQVRPERPLTYPVPPGTYECQTCLYPPCRRCLVTPRPEKGKKWNMHTKKDWVCKECRE